MDENVNIDNSYVVGIDYGTLSGRALVVRAGDGAEVGTAVHAYRHGVIDAMLPATGSPLPPDWALQDPQDYREVLRHAVPAAIRAAGIDPANVVGVGVDFTACTVLPTLADGTPLCEVDDLRTRPHAYVKLWKHHAAQAHADRINALAHDRGEPWIRRYGGKLSAEWQLAKALQLLEEDPEVFGRAERWIEATDWITWQLCGRETRNVGTAGYKGAFQDDGYPEAEFLKSLHPRFAELLSKLDCPQSPYGERAGGLTAEAAAWTGLPEGIAVCVGNIDAHTTAPAAQAVGPGQLVMIMGTSTCHVMNGSTLAEVPGMCGVVKSGITAGMWGYEAGQSGVGDIFAWYTRHGVPPEYHELARERGVDLHSLLSELGEAQPVGAHGLVALDWWNGNRSLLVDHDLSGLIVGLNLGTRPEDVYRALLESTAFGTRLIVEAFETAGLPVRQLIAAGGLIANPVLMRLYADAVGRPLSIIGSEQGPALGAAIHAAVAAGCYPDVGAAAAAMGKLEHDVYRPDPARAAAYDELYAEYRMLHDYFGRGVNDVMHRLRAIRNAAVAS